MRAGTRKTEIETEAEKDGSSREEREGDRERGRENGLVCLPGITLSQAGHLTN